MTHRITDFGNSYMTWMVPADPNDRRKPGHMPWGNSARILIDARCTIVDERRGITEELYLIAPCRTEWMYRETELIQDPSGEYRVIFSQERQLFVGKKIAEEGARDRSVSTEVFTALDFTITSIAADQLTTDREVVDATMANRPLVGKTEIVDDAFGLRATLEYPIRTMNFHPERVRFQVDTGPLIFPDLAAPHEWLIDRCKLAHTVYNTFDYAEFVCKQPTPLVRDGSDVASIFHYSDFRRLPVTNTLFCPANAQ